MIEINGVQFCEGSADIMRSFTGGYIVLIYPLGGSTAVPLDHFRDAEGALKLKENFRQARDWRRYRVEGTELIDDGPASDPPTKKE